MELTGAEYLEERMAALRANVNREAAQGRELAEQAAERAVTGHTTRWDISVGLVAMLVILGGIILGAIFAA